MFNAPKTSAEASTRTYGRDSGLLRAAKYTPTRCAYEVGEPPWYIDSHQCNRKPGYGPNGLYCKQHAKKFNND